MAEVELPNPEELEEKNRNSFSKKVALFTAVYAVELKCNRMSILGNPPEVKA